MVGEAADGQQRLALAARHVPDVALFDVQMPVLDGIEAARRIAADPRLDAVRVVILTDYGLDEYVFDALRAGASGFLLKDTQPADLLQAIRVAARGVALLSPAVTRRLIRESVSRPAAAQPPPAGAGTPTNRERQVVTLVARGFTNDEIAVETVIRPFTAKTHVSRAMTELGARDRAGLVVFAYESGLVTPHGAGPWAGPVTSADQVSSAPRPQSLMLSFFGVHVLGRDTALSAGSLIDVLGRAGITEEAVRSTLTRMVKRGLLARHRQGRKTYFGLTPRAASVLQDGHDRVWRTGAVNRDWDGTWTLVGFSLPEAWRSERHDLRSRLVWGGFGPLQNGLWVAPGAVDVTALTSGLGLDAYLRVFRGAVATGPTDARDVVLTAFDVDGIAKGYEAFLARWAESAEAAGATGAGATGAGTAEDGAGPDADALVRQLLLHTDWLELVRRDPHLPAAHLPEDWPAGRAEERFRELARRYEEPSRREAARVLDLIPVTAAPPAVTDGDDPTA